MVGADGAAARRLGGGDLAVALVVALAVVVGGWFVLVQGIAGTFQDDGIYVATARALAEGRGYRLVNLPEAPPQTRYPILYPAVLAVVWALGDDLDGRLAGMQLLTLGLAALGVAAAGLLLIRFGYVRRASALGGGLLAAASPAVLYFSTQLLSEMPFTLALVGALWTAERWLRDPPRGRLVELLTGALVVLPFLCRSVGIVVAPMVVVLGWLRGRRLAWVVAGALASAAPWLAWMVTQAGAERVDVMLGPQTGYLGWWAWTGMLLDPAMVGANLWRAMESFGYLGLAGPATMLYDHATAGVLMAALGLVTWGALLWRLPQREALPLVLAAYLVVVAVWPWPPERFVVPLLPILMPVLCELLRRLAERLATRGAGRDVARAMAAALVAVVVLVILRLDVREIAVRHRLAREWGYPYLGIPDEPVAWQSFADAFAWMAATSAPDDVIASGFDSMTSLYTGRAAFRPATLRPRALYHADVAPLGTADELRATLVARRPRFLFLSPMPGSPEEGPLHALVDEVRRRWPGLLRVAHRTDDPRVVVFAVDPDAAEAGGG